MDSIDRTAHIVPVACVPTGTTRHEQRPDLPFLLASVASALDPRCTLRYIVHSTQCLSLPAGAPQEGKYSASHQDTPSQLSSGSPSYHSPAEHCNRQSAHQGPGQTPRLACEAANPRSTARGKLAICPLLRFGSFLVESPGRCRGLMAPPKSRGDELPNGRGQQMLREPGRPPGRHAGSRLVLSTLPWPACPCHDMVRGDSLRWWEGVSALCRPFADRGGRGSRPRVEVGRARIHWPLSHRSRASLWPWSCSVAASPRSLAAALSHQQPSMLPASLDGRTAHQTDTG